MSAPLTLHVEETVLGRLREQAAAHGRSAEAEANAILRQALLPDPAAAWAGANAIRERLASGGRSYSDSAELLREDRER
jgi:plasmid stability protein